MKPSISYYGTLKPHGIELPRFFIYGWRRFNEYLYIGQTGSGGTKFNWPHRIIGNREEIRDTDIIEIWECKDYDEINKIEKLFILQYKPLYNKEYLIDKMEYDLEDEVFKPSETKIKKESNNIPAELLMTCTSSKEFNELKKRFKK